MRQPPDGKSFGVANSSVKPLGTSVARMSSFLLKGNIIIEAQCCT